MKRIYETCTPRDEVLSGELRDDVFAARLKDVVEEKADAVYGDAAKFFENTFPTNGLRDLLREALGRLTGKKPNASPIIRLETAFGGGKSHNLIALLHCAKGRGRGTAAETLVDKALLPAKPVELVAGIVGSDLEPASGFLHKDTGIRTYTLAGEIAHQLRGAAGYAIVKDADLGRNAVGTNVLEQIIGDGPALIMLDELGRYMRDAASVPTTANKHVTLSQTTVATLMSLLEFASSRANVVIVLTLADSSDAFGRESDQIRHELEEAKRVSARQERVLTPSNEAEMSSIVRHRLFGKIDRAAAADAVESYMRAYEKSRERDSGMPVPDLTVRAEYREEMLKDYPFHPTLLRTLRRKTSTIPSFQQTRGALRLLARTVRDLWSRRPADATLLHIHHLNLAQEDTLNDLTSRLERPQFRSLVEADIVSAKKGHPSHATVLDEDRVADGKPAHATRLATTIFLHSLTQGTASGVDPSELAESVLQPNDEPALLRKVLGDLEDKCWFLEYDGDRYRFKTEPSLNKLVSDEAQGIPTTKAKGDLDERIRGVWKKGTFAPVYFPSESGDLDDDAGAPKLAVMSYDAARAKEGDDGQIAPELVIRLFEHKGTQEEFRGFKNNVLFLVADAELVDRMVEQVKRSIALDRLMDDGVRMREFSKEQRDKLKNLRDAAELDVRVAITRAYRFLFYPEETAPRRCHGLMRQSLPAQDVGDVKRDQCEVVLRVLKPLGKVLTADDPPKAAAWLKAKAWTQNRRRVSTEDVRKEFARRIGLPILLDVNQLKKTIKNGIEHREWVYYVREDEIGYSDKSPPPTVSCSDETELWLPEEAAEHRIVIKGVNDRPTDQPCLVCGKFPCGCGDEIEDTKPRAQAIMGEGAPAAAFERLLDACRDQKVHALRSLRITMQGKDKTGAAEVKSLGLAIPQMGKGAFRIDQDLALEFEGADSLVVTFKGTWDRYKRLKSTTDTFASESRKLNAKTTLVATFDDGLEIPGPQFETIRDVLVGLQIGSIRVEGERHEVRA